MGQYFFDANMYGDINGAPWNEPDTDEAESEDSDEEQRGMEVIVYETHSAYRWGVKAYDPDTDELVFDTSMHRRPWDSEQIALDNAKRLVEELIATGNLDRTWDEATYKIETNG